MHSFLQKIKKYIALALSSIGVAWSACEIIEFWYDIPDNYQKMGLIFFGLIVPLTKYGIDCLYFSCRFSDQGQITLRVGNIRRRRNHLILVSINTSLANDPKKESLFGQLLAGRHAKTIQEQYNRERAKFPDKKVDVGHHFVIKTPKQEYLFLATAELNLQGISQTTPHYVQTAYHKLFSDQSNLEIATDSLCTPLAGTGRAGISLSFEETIKLIAKEYIICCAQKDPNSPCRIRSLQIIVRWQDRRKMQKWAETCKELEAMAQLCAECQKS